MDFADATINKGNGKGGGSLAVANFADVPTVLTSRNLSDPQIFKSVIRCVDAYVKDGLARQAVDVYTDNCVHFEIKGREAVTKKLSDRLNEVALHSGLTWEQIKYDFVHEFFKTGTSPLLKIRDSELKSDFTVPGRYLYKERPTQISKILALSATQVMPKKLLSSHIGWTFRGTRINSFVDAKSRVAELGDKFKITLKVNENTDSNSRITIFNKLDISVATYKKDPGTVYGIGILIPILDDLTALRTLENITVTMIKKHGLPMTQVAIARPTDILYARNGWTLETEIRKAEALVNKARHDSVLITPDTYTVKLIGSESQALRVREYLDYYLKKIIVGIGVPSFYLGLDDSTSLATDNASEGFNQNIKSCQQVISGFFINELFNELLWEMGFDPFTKEEDRVEIVFRNADNGLLIKWQSHAADLFTKGVIDLDQFNLMCGFDTPVNEKRTQFYLYGGGNDLANQAQAPKPFTKAKAKDFILNEENKAINIYNLAKDMKVPLAYSEVKALLSDREVLVEYFEDFLNNE